VFWLSSSCVEARSSRAHAPRVERPWSYVNSDSQISQAKLTRVSSDSEGKHSPQEAVVAILADCGPLMDLPAELGRLDMAIEIPDLQSAALVAQTKLPVAKVVNSRINELCENAGEARAILHARLPT
jgi:hypothetical protein